jgi:hypothetical protein
MTEVGSCSSSRPTLSIAELSLLCPFTDPAKMVKDSFPAGDCEPCLGFLNLKPQAPQAFSFLKEM